jgi:hypothetical protein
MFCGGNSFDVLCNGNVKWKVELCAETSKLESCSGYWLAMFGDGTSKLDLGGGDSLPMSRGVKGEFPPCIGAAPSLDMLCWEE